MANSVGIDVKIKLPSKGSIEADLTSKWAGMKNNFNLKVNVQADKNSLAKMSTQIGDYFKDREYGVKIKVDLKHGQKKLEEFSKTYNEFRKEFEKGLEMKFDPSKTLNKGMQDLMTGNSKKMMASQQKGTEFLKSAMKDSGRVQTTTQNAIKQQIETADGALHDLETITRKVNAFKTEVSSSLDGKTVKTDTYTDKIAGVKAMVEYTKEIGRLEKENLTGSKAVISANNKVIELNKKAISGLKEDYKKVFGEDLSKNMEVAKAEAASKANVAMQQAHIAKQEQANIDKQRASTLQELVKLENEQYSLAQKQQKAGASESGVYDKQIAAVKAKSDALKAQSGIMKDLTSEQKASYATLQAENKSALAFNSALRSAKTDDKNRANAQKSALQEMKRDLKEIQKLEVQAVEIKSKMNTGGATSKESDKLRVLEAELKVRKQIYEAEGKTHKKKGNLSNEGQAELKALEKQHEAIKKISSAKARAEAEVKKEQSAYKALEASIKRVTSLKKQMGTAGSKESGYIGEVIRAEEKKQAAIEKSIRSQKNFNKAKMEEVQNTKKASYEQAEQDAQRSRLQKSESQASRGGMKSVVSIDPMRVAQTAKRAFMTVYDSLAKVDEQVVNIQKVANVPDEVLEQFSAGLYDQAAKVGKSADEYAESVSRWLTTGKTLQESNDLAGISTMGAFVGNIGESEMVDYMAVPLNAYKDSALEATDVINAMNEVSNNNAIEMEHLGQAYSRAASTASTAGTSFAELTGLITAGQEATRAGGEKIGTALRAVDINFGKMSTGMTKADAERSAWFNSKGIALKDENNQLRSTYDILGDIAGKWDTMSGDDRTLATTYAAGKNHAAVLQGIVKNWGTAEKATRESQEQINLVNKESGSAFKEFESQQDSIQFKTAELTNAWQKFLHTIAGGRDGVNGVLDILIQGLTKVQELVENQKFMSFMKTGLKLGGWMMGAKVMNKFFGSFGRGAADMISNISLIGSAMGKTTKLFGGKGTGNPLGGLSKGLGGVLGMFGKLIPIINIAIAALAIMDAMGIDVFGGIGKFFGKFESESKQTAKEVKGLRKEQEELNKALSKSHQVFDGKKGVDEMVKSYEKLNEEKRKANEKENEQREQSGVGRRDMEITYSEAEFDALQKDFAKKAEALGIDIELSMNDYDDINAKYDELVKKSEMLAREEAREVNKNLGEKYKYAGQDKLNKKLDEEIEKQKQIAELEERKIKLTGAIGHGDTPVAVLKDQHKEYRNETMNTGQTNAYKSDKFIKYEEENNKRIAEILEERSTLIAGVQGGGLPANELTGESVKTMATELYGLKKKDEVYASIQKKIKKNNEIRQQEINIENGQEWGPAEERVKLTGEEFKYLRGLDGGIYSKLSKDSLEWGDSLDKVTKSLGTNRENMEATKTSILGAMSVARDSGNLTENELKQMETSLQSSRAAYTGLVSDWEEQGASLLGVTQTFLAEYQDSWGSELTFLQRQVDESFGEIGSKKMNVAMELELVDGDGFVNVDKIDEILKIPPVIQSEFGLVEADGSINMDNVLGFAQKLGEIENTDVRVKLDVDENGLISLEELAANLDKLDQSEMRQFMIEMGVDETEVDAKLQELQAGVDLIATFNSDTSKIDKDLATYENMELAFDLVANAANMTTEELKASMGIETVEVEIEPFIGPILPGKMNPDLPPLPQSVFPKLDDSGLYGIKGQIEAAIDDPTVSVSVEGDGQTISILDTVEESISRINKSDPMVKIDGDSSKYDTVKNNVETTIATIDGKTVTINFQANKIGDLSDLLAKVGTNQSIGFSGAKPLKSIGVAIGDSISSSFSVGAGEVVKASNFAAKSMSKSSGNPRYNNDKVNEDTWRYWAKELFNGLPLERSMDNLKNSIDAAKDNETKLISLYKQQLKLIDKQIRHEADMKKAKQAELNSVLSDLRKQGFRTSGNKVTNLGRAKSIKGEEASQKANESLNKYKDLYGQLNDINGKMISLNQDKRKANESIKDAETSRELKAIEKRMKKTDSLLTAIKNGTDIMSKKLSLVDEGDFELKLTMTEEGLNSSKTGIGRLVNEFNALSLMYVKNAENAEKVKSKMEELKTEILSNADSVLEYKKALADIELNRLTHDIENFANTMSKNVEKITNNIENLKDGLLDGSTFGDLESSSLSKLDLSRKTKLEKQFEERLQLEANLNEALNGYANKNVDRTAKVANKTLTIERNKYAQLLKLQADYSNGKVGNVASFKPTDVVGKKGAEKNKGTAWTKQLESMNNEYSKAYAVMVKNFDLAMSKAKTQTERDMLTHKFIVDQLKLQEGMYSKIIKANQEASKKANEMLKNTGLSTSQKDALKDALEGYEQAIIDAQNSIKESVKSRYELEFDLMDQLSDKSQAYTKELEQLLSIQEAVSKDEKGRVKLVEAIYESKINEYGTARKSLNDLLKAQSKVGEGNFEWKLLQERIEEVRSSMKDLTLDILEANKDLMNSQIDIMSEDISKGMFDGKTLKQWEDYKDKWMNGLEKELALDKVRKRLIDLESDLYDKKLEALDRQEDVSQKDVDYLDKQLSVLELQEKLSNLSKERDVQTLVKRDDGTWDWEYVANQTEIDKTKDELNEAQLELEKYKDEQRKSYFNDLNDILEDAKSGEYENSSELLDKLQMLKDAYGFVLDDIPGLDMGNFDEIVKIYEDYLANNKDIISGATGEALTEDYEKLVDSVGVGFEKSFRNISDDLGKLIQDAVRSAVGSLSERGIGESYIIEKQVLEFPNVTDTNGFKEVLMGLPAVAKQKQYEK